MKLKGVKMSELTGGLRLHSHNTTLPAESNFSVHNRPEEFKTPQSPVMHFRVVFEENSVREKSHDYLDYFGLEKAPF